MSNSVLITGGAGFIGHQVIKEIIASTDWDIFGTQTGHKTVAGWFYTDTVAATAGMIISHYENATNKWNLFRSTAALRLIYNPNGGAGIDTTAGTVVVSTWHHFAVVISGAEVGVYLDGAQIIYDNTWATDTFVGALYIGQEGGAANYFDGRMQDMHISYNNPYGAAPNVGVTDTFTVPAAPFQGVML